jgi:hypothetical protein
VRAFEPRQGEQIFDQPLHTSRLVRHERQRTTQQFAVAASIRDRFEEAAQHGERGA